MRLKKFYFTFGQGQLHQGKYKLIFAQDWAKARIKMIRKYHDKWSHQYTEEEWNSWIKEADKKGYPVETRLM